MSQMILVLLLCSGIILISTLFYAMQFLHLKKALHSRELELKNRMEVQKQLNSEITDLKHQVESTIVNDALTGLPGRHIFDDRLMQVLNQSKRHNLIFAILFLGLDGFEMVNDALGMDVGDELLREVAIRLRSSVRKMDTICRFGGDSFVLLLPQLSKPETAAYVAQRLLDAIAQPFKLHGQEVFITASIGIAVHPIDGDEMAALIRFADSALHQAKLRGHNHYQFYRKEMYGLSQREFALNTDLRRATLYQELHLYYQPLVDLESKKIINMSTVLRWQHPDFGLMDADVFMHLAENSGIAIPIGEWVLRSACQQFQAWDALGFNPNSVSVTVTLRQLENPHFTYRVLQIIQENKMNPSCIVFEISENVLSTQSNLVEKNLHMFKQMGVRLGINDLGTGNIALQHLRHFPIDTIKISKPLIHDVTINQEAEAIVKLLIALGDTLKLKVIADGVDSQHQKQVLQQLGCRYMQGQYFSKPLLSRDFTSMVENQIVQSIETP